MKGLNENLPARTFPRFCSKPSLFLGLFFMLINGGVLIMASIDLLTR